MHRTRRSTPTGKALSTLSALLLFITLIAPFSLPGGALADGGDFELDFTASEPSSYDHSTGGGAFNDRTIGTDVVESLEGGQFNCEDIVTFLTQIVVGAGATPNQQIEIDYDFTGVSTGQPGVGYYDIVGVSLNSSGDTGYVSTDNDETISLSSESLPNNPFHNGTTDLLASVQVGGLDAGEKIIVRVDVRVGCDPSLSPTGNLQASVAGADVIAPAGETGRINVGGQTVPMKSVEGLLQGSITIIKDAQPNSNQPFNFTGDLGSFSLTDDGNAANATKFVDGLSPDTYTVSETLPVDGWTLDDIVCTGDTDEGSNVNVAGGSVDIDLDGDEDIVCTFINIEDEAEPATITVTKTADPTSVAEPGGAVEFTVEITNNSSEVSVEITSLTDDVFGNLDGTGTCDVPQTIAPSDSYSCSFTENVTGQPGDTHENEVTASGVDENDNPVSNSDNATVDITDVASSIEVTKSASPTSLDEPGGTVTFTVEIENTSAVDDVTIDSIVDNPYGDLADPANTAISNSTCDDLIGDVLAPGATTSCTFDVDITGNAGSTHPDTVAVSGTDDDGDPVSDSGNASVTIGNVSSSINVVKEANPTSVAEPGGPVTFSVTVQNASAVDTVTIDTLSDTVYGNIADASNPSLVNTTCSLNQQIQPNQSYSCQFTANVSGQPGDVETDTVIASGTDDDGDLVSDSDDAEVTITDVPSSILVNKDASPNTVAEPGGTVTFSVSVQNTSTTDDVTINSLTDNVYGNIADDANNALIENSTCAVPQTLAPGATYSCAFQGAVSGNAGSSHTDTVTASGEDDDGNPVSGDDSATVLVTDVASAITVTKTASPLSLPEPGGTFTFTVMIENDSDTDSVTIDSITDDVYGDLADDANNDAISNSTCDDLIGDVLNPGGSTSCTFDVSFTGNAGDSETDTVTVEGTDDDENTVSDSDDATISITDVPSSITVVKTAAPTSIAEPGGNITFEVAVQNNSSVDTVTITSLSDDIHGDLDGQGTCAVPQDIAPGSSYNCSFTAAVSGNAGDSETDTVTASGTDDDGQPVSSSDDATVTITDLASSIVVTKDASPNTVAEPGGTITFTVTVENTSVADVVTIDSLTDDIYGDLTDDANNAAISNSTCAVPQELDPGATYSCAFQGAVSGNAGSSHTDTVTASGEDDDGNPVSGDDSATVRITDVPSAITVTKTANPTSVAEPGGVVSFTVRIDNISQTDEVTINSLVDDVHGDLDGQGSCAVPQTIAAGGSYECSFSANVIGNAGYQETDTVTAEGVDDDQNPVSGSDDATVTITDLPSSISVTKDATPDSLPEPGGPVSFSVTVVNTSAADSVTITSLIDSVYGDLNGQGTCAVPQALAPGDDYSCSFSANVSGQPGDTEIDVVTASGTDDDGQPVGGSDQAEVAITDVPSSINVVKTATPDTLGEPGGSVTFSVTVNNTSTVDSVTITSLNDSIHGNLNGQGTCAVPQVIAAGASYSCSFAADVTGNAGDVETDVVTASGTDDDGNPVSDSDDASVTILDVAPAVNVVKTASPSELPEPGGNVTFSFTVTNTSPDETITITSLVDSVYGDLNGQGTCATGASLAPGQQYSCSFSAAVTGNAGDVEENVVTVTAVDDEQNPVADDDNATVTITDVPSSVNIVKTADPVTVPEGGGEVTFTFTVTNTSPVDTITINSLVDSIYGNLDGLGTCDVPQTLDPGEQYSCAITEVVSGEPGDVITNIGVVDGVDDDGDPVGDEDDATVTVEDTDSIIHLEKSANRTEISSDGENVTYTFTITNQSSVDSITITSLVDLIYGDLAGQGDCGDVIGATLEPGESITCSITVFVTGDPGNQVVNTAIVEAVDDDGDPLRDVDSHEIDVVGEPPVVIPEAPFAILFPIIGLLVAAAGYLLWRRRERPGRAG